MSNTATNVSVGKPKVGGAVYIAPLGTTLPTDATSALSSFTCLGYVSDDGLRNATSVSTEDIKAWGGDVVLTSQTEKSETFALKLIECLDVNVLKAVYGSSNVSGTSAATGSGIVIRANSAEAESNCWVFDTVLTGGVMKRIVLANAKITELGEIVYKDNEAVGYDITLKALPGGNSFNNDTHKEYIIKSSGGSSSS